MACLATGEERVRDAFSAEFKCREDRVEVEELPKARYRVTGCDRRIVYQCIANRCIPDQATMETPSAESESVAAPIHREPGERELAKREQRGDRSVVALDLHLDDRDMLKLRAAPEEFGDLVQLKVTRTGSRRRYWWAGSI
jgi:hypothetical protein